MPLLRQNPHKTHDPCLPPHVHTRRTCVVSRAPLVGRFLRDCVDLLMFVAVFVKNKLACGVGMSCDAGQQTATMLSVCVLPIPYQSNLRPSKLRTEKRSVGECSEVMLSAEVTGTEAQIHVPCGTLALHFFCAHVAHGERRVVTHSVLWCTIPDIVRVAPTDAGCRPLHVGTRVLIRHPELDACIHSASGLTVAVVVVPNLSVR